FLRCRSHHTQPSFKCESMPSIPAGIATPESQTISQKALNEMLMRLEDVAGSSGTRARTALFFSKKSTFCEISNQFQRGNSGRTDRDKAGRNDPSRRPTLFRLD